MGSDLSDCKKRGAKNLVVRSPVGVVRDLIVHERKRGIGQ